MANFSEETIQAVWEKAISVSNNDPNIWRQDECKAWIKRTIMEIEIVNMDGK